MKGLSKSRYTAYCQCPKNLWLKAYKPDEAEIDEALQARFDRGNVVGDLAMGLFGDFKEVTVKKPDGSQDLAQMVELTQQYMQEGVENICEASFSFHGHYCAVDILRKNGNGWDIYEVKSTSFPLYNEQPAKVEKYAPDIAYQKWVMEQCGIHVKNTYLVCLNSNYVRQGELDLQQLFIVIDIKEMVDNEYLKVPAIAEQALKVVNDETEPDVDLGEQCNKPYPCTFLNYCKRLHGVPTPSVFDVYGGSLQSKKVDRFFMPDKLKYYYAGKVSFDDLKDEPLGHIQRLQVEGKEYCDKEGIHQFLDTLTYPLYFLDFETMQNAIPQYDGTKPYSQITFQYSLHIKESEASEYVHKEFLAPSDGSDPRRKLAEQLCRDIPKGVCTLAYNKTFECTRIKELANLYPDLSEHLLDIERNIKDLLVPFRAGYYYLPTMGGSFSIKSVLPALFPDEPSLNYHNLDNQVQNGADAMTIFPKIQFMSPEEALSAREALLRYCELDTWALVKAWERLKEKTM